MSSKHKTPAYLYNNHMLWLFQILTRVDQAPHCTALQRSTLTDQGQGRTQDDLVPGAQGLAADHQALSAPEYRGQARKV